MFIFGRYTTSFFARILICPNYILIPLIIILLMIGAYVGRYFLIDVWIAIAAGILAFVMHKLDFSINAFTLAYVLAGLIEQRFRRALMLSQGSFSIFFNRPFCWILWILLGYMIYVSIKANKRHMQKENVVIEG
jgi:putative tricarboxylic transport membrane protein